MRVSNSDLTFPVLLLPKDRRAYALCPRGVPWGMVAGHDRQADRNHRQSLKELAERGGLDPIELLAVLDDRPYPFKTVEANHKAVMEGAVGELLRRVSVWTNATGTRPDAILRRSWVWECVLCKTTNAVPPVGDGEVLPARVQCGFCKVVHTATDLVPVNLTEDDPHPTGADGSTDVPIPSARSA